MTAPSIPFIQPGQSLQREKRGWTDQYVDQHERRFECDFDKGNLRPIGELRPAGFMPPWLPLMRYIKWDKNNPFRFRWDYKAMADELAASTASYYDEATKLALQLPGDVPVPEPGGPVDRRLRSLLGPPPLSPALPIACENGEPWLLGVPNAEPSEEIKLIVQQGLSVGANETLEIIRKRIEAQIKNPLPITPEAPVVVKTARTIKDEEPLPAIIASEITYQQFLQECKGRKMALPEIVDAWKAHKAALVEDAEHASATSETAA